MCSPSQLCYGTNRNVHEPILFVHRHIWMCPGTILLLTGLTSENDRMTPSIWKWDLAAFFVRRHGSPSTLFSLASLCKCFRSFLRFFESEEQELPTPDPRRGLRYKKGGRIHLFSFIPLTSSTSRRGNLLPLFTHSTLVLDRRLPPLPFTSLLIILVHIVHISTRQLFSLFNFLYFPTLTHSTPSRRQVDLLLFISLRPSLKSFIYFAHLVSSRLFNYSISGLLDDSISSSPSHTPFTWSTSSRRDHFLVLGGAHVV